jgi:hypothetical protein
MEVLPYFQHGAMNRCPTFRVSGRFLSQESKQKEQGNKLYSAYSENRDEWHGLTASPVFVIVYLGSLYLSVAFLTMWDPQVNNNTSVYIKTTILLDLGQGNNHKVE